jgi:hypothetical protein
MPPRNSRGYLRAQIHHFVTPDHYRRRVGRPKIYAEPRVATAIRLPESLHGELLSAAVEREVSVNFLVTRAVADYLEHLPAINATASSKSRGRRTRSTRRANS